MTSEELIKLLKKNKKTSFTIYGVCGWLFNRYFTTIEDATKYYNMLTDSTKKEYAINLLSFTTKYVNNFDFEVKGLSIIK